MFTYDYLEAPIAFYINAACTIMMSWRLTRHFYFQNVSTARSVCKKKITVRPTH